MKLSRERWRRQGSCRTGNQDLVAPALRHMPIEVVRVKVREHPHEERTPSVIVFGTPVGRDKAGIVGQNERIGERE